MQTRKQEITEKEYSILREDKANQTHFVVGRNIRDVIAKNGGTMPEDMETPNKSIKELEKERIKKLKC